MKISRQVGTTNEILNVFVQDATVSTGAGLANVVGSSVSYSWWHDSQASASTGTASTAGSMGTFSTSAWVQVSSSNALGWYQFGAPSGVFAAGKTAAIHFYGAPSMAPLPLEIELTKTDNQSFMSSQTFSSTQVVQSVTNASPANITQIQGQNAVTSASGTLTVSTQALTNLAVNVNQILGQTPVTTAAGVLSSDNRSIWGTATVTSAGGIVTSRLDSTASAALTESYAADGAAATMPQLMYQIWSFLAEKNINSTTLTAKKLDGATGAMTFTLDSSTAPTSITRTT